MPTASPPGSPVPTGTAASPHDTHPGDLGQIPKGAIPPVLKQARALPVADDEVEVAITIEVAGARAGAGEVFGDDGCREIDVDVRLVFLVEPTSGGPVHEVLLAPLGLHVVVDHMTKDPKLVIFVREQEPVPGCLVVTNATRLQGVEVEPRLYLVTTLDLANMVQDELRGFHALIPGELRLEKLLVALPAQDP